MAIGIRNAISETCDGCGKKVLYEKDEDSGLASIEVEPMVWEQLCEECAAPYEERERRYHEEELANAPEAAFVITDRSEGDQEESRSGFGELGRAFAEAWHVAESGRTFVSIQAGDTVLYDNDSIKPILERMAVIQREGVSVEKSARLVATEEAG
jgi:hypothetical protein